MEYVDVLVVGAGISGIGAGYYLQKECPDKSYTILEAREELGGTWSLFQYPGIRSDSDMFTLGYTFRPWPEKEAIAEGGAILKYLKDTAQEFGIASKIRYGHRVEHIAWSSEEARWEVTVARSGSEEPLLLHCNFLYMCSGYYRYDRGYTPEFPGFEKYQGEVIHPQLWPEENDYTDKRVVVIGSGATAVTLVPAMAKDAGHVVMLQRSPTYMYNAPRSVPQEDWLRENLPTELSHKAIRWRRIALTTFFVQASLKYPKGIRKWMLKQVEEALGPEGNMEDFSPGYNPWKQRVCLVPDGDLFKALRSGKASVVTDHIETFTEKGLRLRSGEELEADIIVTATGLRVEMLSGNTIEIDGRPLVPSDCVAYRAMMLSGVPNMAFAAGYTRGGSWTLKVDIVCRYLCRLLNHMDRHGYTTCVPEPDASVEAVPLLDFESGYIQRARAHLPHAGAQYPWRVFENYLLDRVTLGLTPLEDGAMKFSRVDSYTMARARRIANKATPKVA